MSLSIQSKKHEKLCPITKVNSNCLFAETVSILGRSGNCIIIVFSRLLLELLVNFFELDSVRFVKIYRGVQFGMLADGLNPISKGGASGHVDGGVVELFFVLISGLFFLIKRCLGQVLRVDGLNFRSGVAWGDAVFAAALGEHVD